MSSFEPVYLYQIDQNILYVCNEQHEQRSSSLGFVNGVLVWICLLALVWTKNIIPVCDFWLLIA